MTVTTIEQMVRAALHEVAPDVDINTVTPDTDVRQRVGLDSLDFLRYVELLSQSSGQRIDEDDYAQVSTVAKAVAFLTPPH